VIFSIDKTYVYCSDSFVLYAAIVEALLGPVLHVFKQFGLTHLEVDPSCNDSMWHVMVK
jgi:hypothetical protein